MASRIVLIKRYTQVKVTEVSLGDLASKVREPSGWATEYEIPDSSYEPLSAIEKKIEALSDILDCSLEEAERFLLDRQ